MNTDLTTQIATAKKCLDELSATCAELCDDGSRDALSLYDRVAWQREQARDTYVNLLQSASICFCGLWRAMT